MKPETTHRYISDRYFPRSFWNHLVQTFTITGRFTGWARMAFPRINIKLVLCVSQVITSWLGFVANFTQDETVFPMRCGDSR